MTTEEFDALKDGDPIYYYDVSIRVYTIIVKTPHTCVLDRKCFFSGKGTRITNNQAIKYFSISAKAAVRAEIERIGDKIKYHRSEHSKGKRVLQELIKAVAKL